MKCIVFTAFVLGIILPTTYSRYVQFYRKDYTYIEEFDAFYKVHWNVSGLAWNTAFFTCDDEGAILFYPKVLGEWTLVKNLTNKMTEVPNVTEIFVGFHDEFNLGEFITVDGHSTPYPLPAEGSLLPHHNSCITMNIDTGLFNVDSCLRTPHTPLLFVCKKLDDDLCPTIDREFLWPPSSTIIRHWIPSKDKVLGKTNQTSPNSLVLLCFIGAVQVLRYKYVKASRKCYKVNKKPQVWQEAMKTCFMERGVLAVIENKAQAEEIRNMLVNGETYFVGVRRLFSSAEYYTVKGQKFADMYQNPYYSENYDCGTVWNRDRNLNTETKPCDQRNPFICEMEVSA